MLVADFTVKKWRGQQRIRFEAPATIYLQASTRLPLP
jgi:hypothetical protein